MLVVHHLNDSRSQRVLWLLEELELPYVIAQHQRDAVTRLAPPELAAIHPLGKSPVVVDGDQTIIESGAIIDFIIRRHGGGRLQPETFSPAYDTYQQWLHYAEGSAMLPIMLAMYTGRLGEAAAPLVPRITSELDNHLGYVEQSLAGRDYLIGAFSAADVQMSFVGEAAAMSGRLASLPNMAAWVKRFQDRPAYRTALAKGGPYNMGPRD